MGLPFTDIIMQYLAIEMVYLIGCKEKTDVVVWIRYNQIHT